MTSVHNADVQCKRVGRDFCNRRLNQHEQLNTQTLQRQIQS